MADPRNRWESVTNLGLTNVESYSWLPPLDQNRAKAYQKYDQLYWNDKDQYAIRILEGEEPVYVPNPRTIVDTTSHYYLKGLRITTPEKLTDPEGEREDEVGETETGDSSLESELRKFLDRELFYSRFHTAKHAGVARGDYCFHLTADPEREEGKRLSLTSIHPSKVILVPDPDDVNSIVKTHLVELTPHPEKPNEQAVKVLTYEIVDEGPKRSVWREEIIYSIMKPWWNETEREALKTTLAREMLPEPIVAIPVYFFGNLVWDGEIYGSSELRGFEGISRAVSQTTTDQEVALALEGLGVYATDGGKPVDDRGTSTDWEIAPGKVMEVPSGSYFRRVEGVGSIKPSMDHIQYLEEKIREANGLSDVALGRVDVATAQSGIALAIKFMPTLAKIEERDTYGLGKLKQMFFDWKAWMTAYEQKTFDGEIVPTIGDKLPTNRTERINELNNMLDRGVISKVYYRVEMTKLGYVFPEDIAEQIDAETEKEIAQRTPPELQENAVDAATGKKAVPVNNGQRPEQQPNRSNNRNKPNESKGTESSTNIGKQARGGTPRR